MPRINRSVSFPLAALLSGALLWLSWPESGFTPLIFVAFVPLLFIENYYCHPSIKRSALKAFGLFYLTMLTWNSLTTWWIYNSTDVGSFVAIGLNSLFMAIVFLFFHRTKKNLGPVAGYISLIFYWIAFEYLHLHWEISWPWLTLGNVFANHPSWIQWYQFTGVLGGSLWILIVNMLVYQLAKNIWFRDLLFKLRKINIIILLSVSIILIVAPVTFSLYKYEHHKDIGEPINVAVVQPNVDPYNEKFSGDGREQLAKFLRLASTVIDSNTSYLLGPETCLADGIWEENLSNYPSVQTLRKYVKGFPNLRIIIGLTSFRNYDSASASLTSRFNKQDSSYFDVFNSAMQIDGDTVQIYHKSRLVPGVEKMPYPSLFKFLEKYSIALGGTSGSLGVQDMRTNFSSRNDTKVAPAICYESIYGDFMSAYIRNGAQFIAVITNDGWWGNSPGYRQHFEYSRLLAVEFRKSIARSANTGISGFINQRGDVIQKSEWWTDDALIQKIYKNNVVTFYAEHGDYLGFLASFLSVCLILYMTFRKLVR